MNRHVLMYGIMPPERNEEIEIHKPIKSNIITDIIDELGRCIDTIDNLLAARKLPLSDSLHLQGLTESLPDIKQRLQKIYLRLKII